MPFSSLSRPRLAPHDRRRIAAAPAGDATMLRLLLCCVVLTLAACSKPVPPDKEHPVEPQAGNANTELHDAIQAPIDRAKAVDDQVEKATDEQRQAIDAAGG
jgi:hypothetical protein